LSPDWVSRALWVDMLLQLIRDLPGSIDYLRDHDAA
jgi:hypothetical protein